MVCGTSTSLSKRLPRLFGQAGHALAKRGGRTRCPTCFGFGTRRGFASQGNCLCARPLGLEGSCPKRDSSFVWGSVRFGRDSLPSRNMLRNRNQQAHQAKHPKLATQDATALPWHPVEATGYLPGCIPQFWRSPTRPATQVRAMPVPADAVWPIGFALAHGK